VGHKRKRKLTATDATFGIVPTQISISDPALAEFLRMSGITGGMSSEEEILGLTAVYRAQALIAGTIAGLPLKVYRRAGDIREPVDHWLTQAPAGPFDLPPFNWTEMLVFHLLNHAEGYLKHLTNGAGQLIGLWPVHPLAITKVRWDGPDKVFTVAMKDGAQEVHTSGDVTQVLGMTSDGLRGLNPIQLFRGAFQTARAGETAANRSLTTGSLISGLVTTEEDIKEPEAKTIKTKLTSMTSGAEHAGDIAFVNRALKFTPWTMNNVDAQFVESRNFQVEEVARIYGVPPHLLSSVSKVTSWGAGIQEQDLALSKYTLMGWTSRIESALQAVLAPGLYAEFDYKGLLQGTPAQEIENLVAQVNAGLLTKDEARAIMNRPPSPESTPTPPPAGGLPA